MGENLFQYMLYGATDEGQYFVVVFSFDDQSTDVMVQPYLVRIGDVCVGKEMPIGVETLRMNNVMSKGLAREYWNILIEKGFSRVEKISNWKFDLQPRPPAPVFNNSRYGNGEKFSEEYLLDQKYSNPSTSKHASNIVMEYMEYLNKHMSERIYEYKTNYALEA